MKRRCGDVKRGHLSSAGHTPQWGHLHHSVVPQNDRHSVVATIWAIWQRRAADCTTTPQSPKSEKSPFTSYSHRARYMGGLSGTIAQPNRAQSACQGPSKATSRSPNNQIPAKECTVAQSNTHLKAIVQQKCAAHRFCTNQHKCQILVQPERLHLGWCVSQSYLSHNTWRGVNTWSWY